MRTPLTLIILLLAAAPAGAVTKVSVVPAAGGPPRTVATDRGYETHFAQPTWNADGTITLLREGYSATSVVRLDPATGTKARVLKVDNVLAASLAGGVVAYDRPTKRPSVAVAGLDGRVRTVVRLARGARVDDVVLSADGARVAISLERGRGWRVVAADAVTGRVLRRVDTPRMVYLDDGAWSPDAARVAWIEDDAGPGRVSVLDVGTGAVTVAGRERDSFYRLGWNVDRLVTIPGGGAGHLRFLPGGRSATTPRDVPVSAFSPAADCVGYGGTVARLADGTFTPLAAFGRLAVDVIAPSPDGTELLIVTGPEPAA